MTLAVQHQQVDITLRTNVILQPERDVILNSWMRGGAEPVRIEEVRFRWRVEGGAWILDYATAHFRKIKKDGQSYERRSDCNVSAGTLREIVPDVLEAAWPTSTVTIRPTLTEGTPE